MGNSSSKKNVTNNQTLSDADIANNIKKMFKSPNTNMTNSELIRSKFSALETSSIDVQSIINAMHGGNNSRMTVIPQRQRYVNNNTEVTNDSEELVNNSEINFIRKQLYGGDDSDGDGVNNDGDGVNNDGDGVNNDGDDGDELPIGIPTLRDFGRDSSKENDPNTKDEDEDEDEINADDEEQPFTEEEENNVKEQNKLSHTGGLYDSNNYNIQSELNKIRTAINNSNVKDDNEVNVVNNNNDNNKVDVVSDHSLDQIKKNLAQYGITQNGGSMDTNLEEFKNNILNNNTFSNDANYSVTSSEPVNYSNLVQEGGKKKRVVSSEYSSVSGTTNVSDYLSSSSSSSSSSSNSSSDSTSSSSDSELSPVHGSINKKMSRNNNKSKYLRNNYTITSSSQRDYKINSRPLVSSQSSEFHSNHGSEYLNNLRNRDRLN